MEKSAFEILMEGYKEEAKQMTMDETNKAENIFLFERIHRYEERDRIIELRRLILLAKSFDEFVLMCKGIKAHKIEEVPVEFLADMWADFMEGKASNQ